MHYRDTKTPGLAELGQHISILRLEQFRQSIESLSQSVKRGGPFHRIWQITRGYLVALYDFCKHLSDQLDFTFIRWNDLGLNNILVCLSNITILTPTPEARLDVGFGTEELADSMRQAFLLVKEISHDKTGIEIRSAIIVGPDFFNTTMNEVLMQAAITAGIDPQLLIDRKTAIQSYDNPPESVKKFRRLLLNFKNFPELAESYHEMDTLVRQQNSDCKVFLMIDYREQYLDIQIKGCPCRYNQALDHLGFYRIAEEMTMRYILMDNAPLKQELEHGGLYGQLAHSVYVARRLMHYSCAGTNTTDDAQHCEEWPLALPHALRTDERINTILYWNDLQEIEQEYVQWVEQYLATAVEQFQGNHRTSSRLWQHRIMLTWSYRGAMRE